MQHNKPFQREEAFARVLSSEFNRASRLNLSLCRRLHGLNYSPTDPFRNLRHYCVPKRSDPLTSSTFVQEIGKPINHSTHSGFNSPPLDSMFFTRQSRLAV
jgi:hypothetical protein